MSLRARLVLGLAVVAALGLAVVCLVTYGALRSFLLDRVDQQLDAARLPARTALAGETEDAGADTLAGAAAARRALPAGAYAELRSSNGITREAVSFALGDDEAKPPPLPERLPGSGGAGARALFTAGEGGDAYRVVAEALPRGGTLVVGFPLSEVRRTLGRLVAAEATVALGVLAVIALAGWWLVGLGLRPLDEIGTTAAVIAGGDLGRRVADENPRTEVGRLGRSLNAMLAHIEHAFSERRASEDRLRRFLADASHELRTPLTSIRGYAELFRRGADRRPDHLATAMRRIEEEAARMGGLVDSLLLLARLDQDRPPDRRPVDVAVLAADAVADAHAAQPARPVSLDAPQPAMVLGDEDQLRQVVGNLVTNALVHTPADCPVAVRVQTEPGAVVLEVADEGPGLEPETARRVFERFTKGEPARAAGGSGLGLAIVEAVAAAHGGQVEVAPGTKAGATFRLRLPSA